MMGAWVWSLVQEDSTRRGAPNPVQLLSPNAATTESHAPRACALKQEKPLKWEAHALQLESSPHLQQLEKACANSEDPVGPKVKVNKKLKKKKFKPIFPTLQEEIHSRRYSSSIKWLWIVPGTPPASPDGNYTNSQHLLSTYYILGSTLCT